MSRIEYDFLGGKEIPDDCYYGVQTLRGKENFHVTEMSMAQEPFFIIAFAYVKKAAAMANKELGTIPANVADALIWACDQLIAGKYHDQFVTDWVQGGAGTSTNMNCNEVICNLAAEKLGPLKSWVPRRVTTLWFLRTTMLTSVNPPTTRIRPLSTLPCCSAAM